jgi:hypothetical protein
MRGPAIGAVAFAAMALMPRAAQAAGVTPCPVGEGPWLRVSFTGDGFAPALQAQVTEQLGADLRTHHVVLCDAEAAPSNPSALARVDLSLSASRVLSLDVSDAVTDKRMTRQIPLGGVPRDALALSIALAAEELLHASWIEAALVPPESPAPSVGLQPVPPVVREVNQEQIAHLSAADTTARATEGREARAGYPSRTQVALLTAIDRSTGGQTDLGADVRVATGGRLAVEGELGVRAAPDVASAHGTVQGRELLAGVGASLALVSRRAPWGLQIGARANVIDVEFSAVAAPGASASSGSQLGAALSGCIGAWWRLGGPWRLLAEGAAGAPLRAVTATDVGNAATGVSGAMFGATIGVGATLGE